MKTFALEQTYPSIIRFFDKLFQTDEEREADDAKEKLAEDIKNLVHKDVEDELDNKPDPVEPAS